MVVHYCCKLVRGHGCNYVSEGLESFVLGSEDCDVWCGEGGEFVGCVDGALEGCEVEGLGCVWHCSRGDEEGVNDLDHTAGE